jgi:hypothetical protein
MSEGVIVITARLVILSIFSFAVIVGLKDMFAVVKRGY